MTVAGTDFHQCQHAASRPACLRTTLHLVFVGEIKRLGHRLAVVAEKLLPSVPQIHAVGPAFHRLKLNTVPKRVIQSAVKYAVVMQNRADIDYIVFLADTSEWQYRFSQPRIELVALFRVADLLVILDIVQNS